MMTLVPEVPMSMPKSKGKADTPVPRNSVVMASSSCQGARLAWRQHPTGRRPCLRCRPCCRSCRRNRQRFGAPGAWQPRPRLRSFAVDTRWRMGRQLPMQLATPWVANRRRMRWVAADSLEHGLRRVVVLRVLPRDELGAEDDLRRQLVLVEPVQLLVAERHHRHADARGDH